MEPDRVDLEALESRLSKGNLTTWVHTPIILLALAELKRLRAEVARPMKADKLFVVPRESYDKLKARVEAADRLAEAGKALLAHWDEPPERDEVVQDIHEAYRHQDALYESLRDTIAAYRAAGDAGAGEKEQHE